MSEQLGGPRYHSTSFEHAPAVDFDDFEGLISHGTMPVKDHAAKHDRLIVKPRYNEARNGRDPYSVADHNQIGAQRLLDLGKGHVRLASNEDKVFRGCAIKVEMQSSGQSSLTIIKPHETESDCEPLTAPRFAAHYNADAVDYPAFDDTGRSRLSFNQKYQIAYRKDGSIRAQTTQLSGRESSHAPSIRPGPGLSLQFNDRYESVSIKRLRLGDKLELTYEQINGLGSDLFVKHHPIHNEKTFEQQCRSFLQAFECFSSENRSVEKTGAILNIEKGLFAHNTSERLTSNPYFEAEERKQSDSQRHNAHSYRDLSATFDTEERQQDLTAYLHLVELDIDHFAEDARKAYSAGHFCAMMRAAEGQLEKAYAINAFADHFLGDLFVAGHMRTPRRILHGKTIRPFSSSEFSDFGALAAVLGPDLCSKLMREEENLIGLHCRNQAGDEWQAFGGERMISHENIRNLQIMQRALQASIDEVFQCFSSGKVLIKDPQQFAGLTYTPLLGSLRSDKNHSPMFDFAGRIRRKVDDLYCYEHRELDESESWLRIYQQIRSGKVG